MRRYAVYGGSFDPVHYGHLTVVQRAVALGYQVLVVPAFRHAFGKRSAPFADRLQMCTLALQACQLQEQAHVCRIEATMAQERLGPIYTYDVLCRLQSKLERAPTLLVGPDIATEWERWRHHREIDQEFGRISLPVIQKVRSTDIRAHMQSGGALDMLCTATPEPVARYILAHGLYREHEN